MARVLGASEVESQELHTRLFGAVDQVRLVLREVAVRSEAGSGGSRVVAVGYRCLENLAEELVRSAEGGSGVVVREPTSGRVVGGSGLPAVAVLAQRLALDLAVAMKADLLEAPQGPHGQRLRALFVSLEEELHDMTEILGASHKW